MIDLTVDDYGEKTRTFIGYSNEAKKTINKSEDYNHIVYSALGLAGETGEVVELIKKWYGQGHNLDLEKLVYEMGDVLWYLNSLCVSLGIDFDLVAQMNIKKLRKRYGEKFDTDKSVNRVDNM